MTTQTEVVHHRPAVGAPTACGFEARAMTTSTAWGMVTCPACTQAHADARPRACPECEGYGDPDPDGCPRCGKRGFRG